VTEREQIAGAVAAARASTDTVVIDFRVEQEDSVYPMVPAGADLHDMIRRPSPLVEPVQVARAHFAPASASETADS
jgi:acetolactate synthase-1/2/3 large subunit